MNFTNAQHLARARAVARLLRRGIDIRLETALDGRGRERCSIFVGTKKMLVNASPFWAAPWVDGFAAALVPRRSESEFVLIFQIWTCDETIAFRPV
jgi:hypothetical protein